MDGLIEALKIFRKYDNPDHPTHCEHDVLYITGSPEWDPETMHEADVKRLALLGFYYEEEDMLWVSYRYGSA